MHLSNIFNFIGHGFEHLGEILDDEYLYNIAYLSADPLGLKRVDYPLDSNSIVVDIGGLNGDWASRIYCRYSCYVNIFEPNPEMIQQAKWNFEKSPKVIVHNYGISNEDGIMKLYGDVPLRASLFKSENKNTIDVSIKKASSTFKFLFPMGIDLLKINAEGAEYFILPDLIENYDIKKIHDIQIQFHKTIEGKPIENAEEMKKNIQKKLSETHELTYCYKWAFENWRLKK